MNKLTEFAVQSVMDLLIHTNGQTTTLEIKNQLRELDYLANQDEAHEMVEAIYTADDNDTYKYDRNVVNSKYNTYSFSQTFLDANPEYSTGVQKTVPVIDAVSMSGSSSITTVAQTKAPFSTKNDSVVAPSVLSAGPVVHNMITKVLVNLREPLFIFYTVNHAKKSATDPQNWVVYHKNGNNEIQIFDRSLTRDTVRSRYASIMKVKIQDVRSCKFQNY